MAQVSLRERIKRDLFLLDGAMGTQLIARGIEVGKRNDYLNIGPSEDFLEPLGNPEGPGFK